MDNNNVKLFNKTIIHFPFRKGKDFFVSQEFLFRKKSGMEGVRLLAMWEKKEQPKMNLEKMHKKMKMKL